jgi:hypothetical protein
VFGPSVEGGYQWMWDGGFVIDLGIGIAYRMGTVKAKAGNYEDEANVSGAGFSGRLGFGYAWK